MNVRMTEEVYSTLPSKENIEGYPIPDLYYKDKDGGVALAKFWHKTNWNRYWWDNFNVTIVDNKGRRI